MTTEIVERFGADVVRHERNLGYGVGRFVGLYANGIYWSSCEQLMRVVDG